MISVILRGGLGNNLYQMAAAFGHAKKHGLEYAIPLEVENPHYVGQKPYIFPGINYCDKLPDLPKYAEPAFHYNEIPEVDDIVLDGYFQSFKYLHEFRDEFMAALGFNWQMNEGWCGAHIRRGDYLRLPDYHPFVGEKFLTDAVNKMYELKGITKFRIFSNDIPWCKEFFAGMPKFIFDYAEGNTEIRDMEEMARCEHSIISNSTFSAWASYLNRNLEKMVISPQKDKWFGKLLNHNVNDLYLKDWVLV